MLPSSYPASYYAASANEDRVRPSLQGEVTSDICVIGAGFTGLSSALHLAECGFSVTVLEASRIGFGASGRNGGQIVNGFSRDMDFIEKHHGKTTASAMGNMAFEGEKIIRRIVEQYAIECDLKPGGIFAACNAKQMRELEDKKRLWESYGHTQLELFDATELKAYVDSNRYHGGLLDHSGGHFHPLNLTLGEANAIESLGGSIYEASPVVRIDQGKIVKVNTETGSGFAQFAIVAGNAYQTGLLPQQERKSMPCGTQVVTTEPLSDEMAQALLPRDYCVEDCNYLLDYYRLSADKRLIYGGGTNYGAREPDSIESLIMPKLLKTFPQLAGVKIDYAWTGNFLLTLMRLPQFGRIGDKVFYAQGYSGHGLTSTHLAGKLMSEVIQGQSERFDVFAGLPQYPFPGGRLLRVPYTALGAWYYDLRDRLGV